MPQDAQERGILQIGCMSRVSGFRTLAPICATVRVTEVILCNTLLVPARETNKLTSEVPSCALRVHVFQRVPALGASVCQDLANQCVFLFVSCGASPWWGIPTASLKASRVAASALFATILHLGCIDTKLSGLIVHIQDELPL